MATTTIKLEKNKLVAEDFEVGVSSVIQQRQGQETQLTQVNATHLLGPLVVESVDKLVSLDPNLMLTQTVIVKENHTIYTWDSTSNTWVSSTKGIYVVDSIDNLKDVPEGYTTAIIDGYIYNKINNQWTIVNTQVFAVDNYSDIANLPNGITSVIVKTTGVMYYKQGINWVQVQFSEVGDNIKVVNSIQELSNADFNIYKAVILQDKDRSGIFLYEEDNAGITDNGIIFNGWTRIYNGAPSLYWYGVKADGVTDDTLALQSFLAQHSTLELNEGSYKITQPLTIGKSVRINGNGATLIFGENVNVNFIGKLENAVDTVSDLALGSSFIETNGSHTFKVNDTLMITGTNIASGYSSKKYASFLANVGVSNSPSLMLTQAAKSSITGPKVQRVNAIVVEITNLKIVQELSTVQTCITFEYCKNVKLDNVTIETNNINNTLVFRNCYNTQLNACDIKSYGSSAQAIKIVDSDNTIIKSSDIFGQKCSIYVGNDTRQVNQLGIFESILASSNDGLEVYSLYCEDAVVGVSVHNSQLTGNISLGGSTYKFNNCLISCYDKITPREMNGGEISFTNNTLMFLLQSQQNICFGNGSSSHAASTNWLKVTSPIHFNFTNNTFVINANYTTILQLVSVPVVNGGAEVKHAITYKGNSVMGNTNYKELTLYGTFTKAEVNCGSEKVDLLSIYAASVNDYTGQGVSTPKCGNIESFFTNNNYTSNKLCFADVTVNSANYTKVTSSVLVDSDVKVHSGESYVLKHPIKINLA